MAELLIRAGARDAALVQAVLGGPPHHRPHRVVVDAHVASAAPSISVSAKETGVPFLIDPQTFYLQDVQHPADPWAQLTFADPQTSSPSDLCHPRRIDALVAGVVDYQLACGATAIVMPYVHVEAVDDGWGEVQAALWRATRRYVDRTGLALPTVAVLALGWRLLDRSSWPDGLDPLGRALDEAEPTEVALAASRVDAGVRPEERLASLIAVTRRLSRRHPVLAWQQGTLGEAAVAAGARAYECGIGWRERCDLRGAMSAHRQRPSGGGARPVYIAALKRGIPKASVRSLLEHPRIAPELVCLDVSCCPGGRRALLEDGRAHAIRARLRSLEAVAQADRPAWRWHLLAREAAAGLELAARINVAASRTAEVARVDDSALRAVSVVAEHRRQVTRRRPAA
ncbi:MAG: hypothetical protein WD794_15905 [Mycobacteriales bacterium]